MFYNSWKRAYWVNNKVTNCAVDLDNMFNIGGYMTNKKITVVGNTRKFNIDLSKLPDEILSDLEGISCTDIQQSNFVSKINKAKKPGGAMPSPRDLVINFEKGLDRIYGTKPLGDQANPFVLLQKIKPSASENKKLSWFKSAVVKAGSPKEMHKVVDQALSAGIRINACHEGEWSFAEYVILGMHFHKFKKGDQKKIMSKLILRGAEFHDNLLQNKLVDEIYKELQPEVQPQIDKQLGEQRKIGENAVREGNVIGVEIDNKTCITEFSEGSTVEVAKVLEGLNRSSIIKMGDSTIEVESEKGGKRDYIGVSGTFEITFPTSIGGLGVVVYHDAKNYGQVQVRVADREMWDELQRRGEVVGKDCLFGGMTVEEAVKRGNFPGRGILGENKDIEEREAVSEALSSSLWTDRIHGGSQETFRAR